MKRLTHHLTVLIILQVAIVILLVVMTIFSYQNRGGNSARGKEVSDSSQESALTERISALEGVLGLRDPEVDTLKDNFEKEEATARTLEERMAKLDRTPSSAIGREAVVPRIDPSGSLSEPAPVNNPLAAGLTDEQRAVADLQSVAKVTSFDLDWNFCKVAPGPTVQLEEGQEYGIRHSYQIIGKVSITRVEPQEAIADIIRGSLVPGTAPAPGDDLVILEVPQN